MPAALFHRRCGMRRFMMYAAMGVMLVMMAAGSATAQIGKSVSVAAGTPEDKALTDIYAAPDGPDKVTLLDKFMADYGKGEWKLLGISCTCKRIWRKRITRRCTNTAIKCWRLNLIIFP